MIFLGASLQSYEAFKTALGQRESGNNYSIVNKYGYTGRYQFGSARLKDLGFKGTMTEFRNNPSLQEHYFDLHVQDHARNLIKLLPKAQQRNSNITISGLVAGAHLKGRGGVSSYVNSGVDGADAFGTRISSYITQFSGYSIPGYDSSITSTGIAKGATKTAGEVIKKDLPKIAAIAAIPILFALISPIP